MVTKWQEVRFQEDQPHAPLVHVRFDVQSGRDIIMLLSRRDDHSDAPP